MSEKIKYFRDFEEDLVESSNQDYVLPQNYVWVRKDFMGKFLCKFLYGLAYVFALLYSRFFLRVKVVGREKFKEAKGEGFFLYGNHTQPIGDAFVPAVICRGRRIYTVVSPANLGIPVLGKVLPFIGALPIPANRMDLRKLNQAIGQRIKEKQVVIVYPEAHVWPYYTKIRPFPATSFHYPVTYGKKSYCMTTTYQRAKIGKRPRVTIYIDGPFVVEEGLSAKEQRNQLRDEIRACMTKRSRQSNYEYIKYVKESE